MKAFRLAFAGVFLVLCASSLATQTLNAADMPLVSVPLVKSALAHSSSSSVPAPIVLSAEDVLRGEVTLTIGYAALVKRTIPVDSALEDKWDAWAKKLWASSGHIIDHDQALVVVNRNPKVEEAAVIVAHPHSPWTLIGVSPISTGQFGRFQHFITPVGVFDHDGSNMDYRALGTKNKNGIRGIGAKGSRVWDFGWQQAQTGWLKHQEVREIHLEMHATDPDYLEQRLGHPASEGCVRIGAGLNKFLDHFGVMDEVYWSRAADSRALRALLPKDAQPTLAGRYLVVVDVAPEASPVVSSSVVTPFISQLDPGLTIPSASAASTTTPAIPLAGSH